MPLEGSFPAMYVGGSASTYFLLEAKVGKEDPFSHRSENSLFQASLQAEELAKVQTARSSQ